MIEVNTAGGFNAAERLTYFIPANTPTYTYNYNVDCNNDGIFEATNQAGSYTCNYPSVGVYTIAITGQYPHYYRPGFLDRKLIDVKQWGTQVWQSMRGMFQNVENITDFSATDQPDLSQVTDMSRMFSYASAFNQDVSDWDVSNVTNMESMFDGALSFNNGGVALDWADTSSLTDTNGMFYKAESFNQDISGWDVSNVTNMSEMFGGWGLCGDGIVWECNLSFNQDISNWDVSNVTRMYGMFSSNKVFNQPIGSWDVSKVADMTNMFYQAESFNQDLSSWDISQVTSFDEGHDEWSGSFLKGTRLSNLNYDQILAAWPDKLNPEVKSIHFGEAKYCNQAGHDAMAAKLPNWTELDWEGKEVTFLGLADGGQSDFCAAPTITSQADDAVINQTEDNLVVRGRAFAGARVLVRMGSLSQTVTADIDGNYMATFSLVSLAPGDYSVTVQSTDDIDFSPVASRSFSLISSSSGSETTPTAPNDSGSNQAPATGVGQSIGVVLPAIFAILIISGLVLKKMSS